MLFSLFLCLFINSATLEISPDHHIYYSVSEAQTPSAPTVLLFNGLVYPLENWKNFATELNTMDYKVIQFAYSAQPESLRSLDRPPYYLDTQYLWGVPTEKGFSLEDIAENAKTILDRLKVQGPVIILGLSYGGMPAVKFAQKFPERTKHLVLTAPAVRPSHAYHPMMNLTGWASYFDFGQVNPAIDYQYRVWMRSSMRDLMWKKYQRLGEDYLPAGLDFETFFTGVYHMARAARYQDLRSEVKSLKNIKVTTWLAEKDETLLLQDQKEMIENLRRNRKVSSQALLFKEAYHAMPGAHPVASALILEHILMNFRDGKREQAQIKNQQLIFSRWSD